MWMPSAEVWPVFMPPSRLKHLQGFRSWFRREHTPLQKQAPSVAQLYLELHPEAIIEFDGSFNWLENITTLKIHGGKIGNTSAGLTGDYASIYYSNSTAESLEVVGTQFEGASEQLECIKSSAGGNAPNRLNLDFCQFKNFTRNSVNLWPDNIGETDAQYIIENCLFENIGTQSVSNTTRAVRIGTNTAQADNVIVKNCTIRGVTTANADANGILIYGRSVLIEGNHVEDITNTKGDDCEGIYVKAVYARIVNNFVLDGCDSHDGAINIKGLSWDGDQESGFSVISGNTVLFEETGKDVTGITVNKSHVICSNNILTDLRTGRSSQTYGYAIGIGTSSPVSQVTVESNIVTGFKSYFGEDATYRANPVDDVTIRNNICTKADGGNLMIFRCDAKVQETISFVASSNTISIDDTSAVGFDPYAYPVGSTLTVNGSVSNDANYTITAIARYVITVSAGITDETSTANVEILRQDPNGFSMTGNIFQFDSQSNVGIRKRCGSDTKLIEITGNVFTTFNDLFRMDAGTPDVIDLRNNTYRDVADKIQGSISATVFKEFDTFSSGDTGGAGSAGSGNQYFELTIDGNTYKVLHDGTV